MARIPSLLAFFLILLSFATIDADASDRNSRETYLFEIDASSLARAIKEISKQTNVEIIATLPENRINAPSLYGQFTVEEALIRLLGPRDYQLEEVSGGFVLNIADVKSASIGATARPSSGDAPEVIYVVGFRNSVIQARDAKRSALTIQDSILAQDIARFPDLNLAESLQRVPGVTITRERGEGGEISLRGLGPDFTRVHLNGMEVLTNTDRDRGFEFNVFASELFSQVDVRKTYTASLDEGGIGGAVQLVTPKPYDFSEPKLVLSAQLGSNTNAGALDQRVTGLAAAHNDTIGALVSFAYSDRTSQGQDASTFRYRARSLGDADISALSPALQSRLNDGEIFIPRGNRYRVSTEEQKRIGLTATLQWRAGNSLDLNLNGLFSRYELARDAENIQTRGDNSFPTSGAIMSGGMPIAPTIVRTLRVNDNNEFVYGEFSGATIGAESTRETADITFFQTSIDGEWRPTDRLKLNALVGYSRSEMDGREDKFYSEAIGEVTLDYEGANRFDPQHLYLGGANAADPSIWRAHEIDLSDRGRDYDFFNARLDGQLNLSGALFFETGVGFKSFEHSGFRATNNNLLRNDWETGAIDAGVVGLAYPVTDHYSGRWIGVDVYDALRGYGVVRDAGAPDPNEDYAIREGTVSAYGLFRLEADLAGIPVRASAGLRYFDTKLESEGLILSQSAAGETRDRTVLERRTDDWLPTVNLAATVAPDTLLRFSYSQNITRPPLSDLSLATSLRTDDFQDIQTGNPNLRSFESDNFDLYIEHYHGDLGFIAVGFFYKDVRNFITRASKTVAFAETGLPLSLLDDGQDGATPFTFVTLVNSQDAAIKGAEFAFQTSFDVIHQKLRPFGVIGNYTFADGSLDFTDLDGARLVTTSFPGLSKHSANGSLFYETDRWGIRGSVAFRSNYITDVEVGLADEDSRGRLSTVFVDSSAFFAVSDRVKLTLEGLNLTNEKEFSYSDSSRRLTERRRSGATLFAGVSVDF